MVEEEEQKNLEQEKYRNLQCRMYENEYPKQGDVVYVSLGNNIKN